MILYYTITYCLFGFVTSIAQFSSSPPATVYGILSDSVSLTWAYGAQIPTLRSFIHVFPNGTERLIISIQNAGTESNPNYVENINPIFANRVSFTQEQAGITLDDLSVEDEGSIKCEVTLSNYDILSGAITLKVMTAQLLQLAPRSLIRGEFENVTLTCIVNSRPASIIKWYKGNTRLSNDSVYTITQNLMPDDVTKVESTLLMPSPTRNETGSYKCESTYQHGVVEDVATVDVHYKPEFTKLNIITQSMPDKILEGSYIILRCSAEALPQPEYSLYNSTTLLQKKVFGEMILANVQNDQEGEYKCQASNTIGNGEMIVKNLTVHVTPKLFSSSAPTITIAEGDSVEIFAEVHGDPKPTHYWTMPSGAGDMTEVNLINSENLGLVRQINSLTNPSVARTDAGVYAYYANNTYNHVTSQSVLIVEYPPTITSFPAAELYKLENTENVDIVCKVQANPSPTVNWFIDNTPLNNSDARYTLLSSSTVDPVTGDTNITSMLRIKKLIHENLGNYKCEGVNTVTGKGEQKSEKSTTLIISHIPIFLNTPSSVLVANQGSDVILNCDVQGYPTPHVWWETNSTAGTAKIENVTTVDVQTGKSIVYAVLTVKNIQPEDFGLFTCMAVTTGPTQKFESKLMISYVPIVNGPDPILHVTENNISSIQCEVTSYPTATISWLYAADKVNYVDVTSQSSIQQVTPSTYESKLISQLDFSNDGVKRTDRGAYYCYAVNTVGTTRKDTEIIVDWKPEFQTFEGPSNPTVNLGDPISFNCVVASNPKSAVRWYKDDTQIPHTMLTETIVTTELSKTVTTLVIPSATVTDAAVYSCRATNNVVGIPTTVEEKQEVKVLYAPIVTAAPTVQVVNLTQDLTMSCAAHGYPSIQEYRWTKDGVSVPNNRSTLEISYVDRAAQASYDCTPVNSVGNGNTVTHQITVRLSPIFTQNPTCQQVVLTKLHCQCNGIGYPTPSIYWTKASADGSKVSTERTFNVTIDSTSAGTYFCNLENSNGINSLSVEIIDYTPSVTGWTPWTTCNSTCGKGIRQRNRSCNFQPCNEPLLQEQIECTGTACPETSQISQGWHEDWYIVLWIAIPVLAVLFILCCLWCCRSRTSSKRPVHIPLNRDITRYPSVRPSEVTNGSVRTITTSRDIYLPPRVPISGLNTGYLPDEDEVRPPPPVKKTFENLEAQLHFHEEVEEPVLHQNIPVIIEEEEEEAQSSPQKIHPSPQLNRPLSKSPQTPRENVDAPYDSLYDKTSNGSKRRQLQKKRANFSYRDLNGYNI